MWEPLSVYVYVYGDLSSHFFIMWGAFFHYGGSLYGHTSSQKFLWALTLFNFFHGSSHYHFLFFSIPEKLTKRSSSYLRGVRLQISDESFTAIMEECVGKCSIDLLLEASADVNSSNNSGLTVCHFTARQGNVQLMEVILKHGADLSAKCHLGRTPIFEIRTSEMFEYMSQQGAALSVIDHSGNTLLHVLSQSKNINSKIFHDIIKTLAKDTNARNADRVTSLHLACSSGDVGKVESLCDLGADIDAIDSAGQNALHHALYSGHDAVAQCLVLRGIAVNLPDNSGYTPLHVSLRKKSATETIRIIADHAGDMNCRDGEGRLPANMAVSFGHFGALKVLLERSAIIEEEPPAPKLPNDVILNSNDNSNNNTEFDKCYASEHKLVNGNAVHDKEVGPVTSAFHLAVQHGDLSVIQELMRQKLDVNRVDADGLTSLHLALLESKTTCAEQLLSSKKTDVNTISVGGFTPLHDCILHCDSPHVLNLMIDLGVIFDIKTPSGDTALHLGLKENRKMATELLVKSGAGLSVIDAAGDSACHLAVKLHNEKECEDYLMLLLIDSENNGEHTEERIHSCLQLTDREGRTVLHHVLVKGYLELFSRLVAAIGPRDIDRTINVIDSSGKTALHYAADNGHLTACTALIQAGAALINVNRPPYQSVLSLAAASGHVSIVELLVKNNATIEVDHRNKDLDQHPLIVALQSGHDKVAEVLFNSGTSISKLCTSKGQSALHLSAASCSLATVRRVIEMEEDTNSVSSPAGYSCRHFLNLCDSQGQTALHMSIQNDNTDVLDLLVREGSDVNQCDTLGNTPLHLSASRTVVSYVHADALITAGASIDLRNALGQTALHLAVQQAETDVLELLVANEADINLQDISGKTALMLAIECGKIEAAEILLGYDADVRCHDNGGQSALHKAVVVRDVKPSSTRQLIRQLIKRGARLIDRDENGKTPLDLASDDVTSLLSQLNLERP